MGTNTLVTTSTGSIILASDVSQYRTALIGDIVPRTANGSAVASGGNIGTATYPFSNASFSGGINVGTSTGAGNGQIKTSGTINGIQVKVNSGNSSVIVGSSNSDTDYNTVVGIGAGLASTTGDRNVFVGYQAGKANATGSSNIAIGMHALELSVGTVGNIAIGDDAVQNSTNIGHSIGIGYNALKTQILGNSNVAIGYNAGNKITTGSTNVFVGEESGNHASQKVDATNSTALGNASYTDASNQMVYGDANVTQHVFRSGSLISATQTPANAGSAGVAGTITWDANFIYVCTATNTWKKVAIATW